MSQAISRQPPAMAAPGSPPSAGVPRLEIPGFELICPIGEGGMGTVYKAVEIPTGRTVALKVVNPALLSDTDMVLRFRREVQAAMLLNHPNIVTVYDDGQFDGLEYLIMEFVDGIDLEQLVARAGHLAVERACDYARQAALGLAHAHERGIVHRDIKPPNLMVGRADGVVKILDMGLVRLLEPGHGPNNALLTQTGAFLGTADFVAPEQGLDARYADHRADLYSLGCTLYYLLTGAVPFPGGKTIDKLDRRCWDNPIPVTALRPEVPAAVEQVLAKLMARRPEDRYQSAVEVAIELSAYSTPSAVLAAAAATPSTPTDFEVPLGEAPPLVSADPTAVGECGCWEGHKGSVVAVALSPDGRRAYSAGQEGYLIVRDVASGAEVSRWRACRYGLVAMALSPTGRRVFVAGADRHIRTWDVEAGVEVATWPDPVHEIRCMAIASNGRHLLTGMADGSTHVWYTSSAKQLRRVEGHRDAVLCVAFSPDGTRFISGGAADGLRLWETESGQEVRRAGEWFAETSKVPVHTVAFSPHGRRILSAGAEHALYLWDAKTGRRAARFGGHRGWVYSAVFAPDGRHILSGSGDKTIRLWDINGRRELICFTGHNDRVTCVAISPDGRFAVSGSLDKTVRLWRFPE